MKTPTSRPVVLCLSGHDPSGGAGLQADIEALLAQGCHAAPAVTALTVQDTVNVSDFRVLDREWVLAQANAVLADLPVAAVKLGMLGSLEMVDTVAEILAAHPHLPVVCDPVLRAGGGGALGKGDVGFAMRERLLPRATIATPNLPEARLLADLPEGSADQCAERLLEHCEHLLITGGHGDESEVHFAFVAVSAGDQQVLAVFQQALGALVGAALGQVGEQARFRQVRRGDGGARQQPLAHGEADVALAQRTAAAGAQHRIADHRQVRVGGEDLGHRVDHLQRTEHTQLDCRDGQVGEYGVGLGQHPLAVEDAEVADVDGVLHGQCGDRRGGVAALGEQGFDVGLQSGATTGVVTGQAEHYGAGSRCFHGA